MGLFATEYPGSYFGLGSNVMAFYLALPFGRSGSPGCFGEMDDAIPKWHNAHGASCPTNSGSESCKIFLFVDDGILVEPDVGARCVGSAQFWEKGGEMTSEQGSVNDDNLKEEGEWGCEHLVLRYIINTPDETIPIPESEIRGAQSLIHLSYLNPGIKIHPIRITRELRGGISHCSETGGFGIATPNRLIEL